MRRQRRGLIAALLIAVLIISLVILFQARVVKPDNSLRYTLNTAIQLVFAKYNHHEGVSKYIAIGQHDKMFFIFKQSGRFHTKPSSRTQDYFFKVETCGKGISKQDSVKYYSYDSKTGEFGSRDEWSYVPDEFKAWILTLNSGSTASR